MGRATELVFVLSVGTVLVTGSAVQVQAQSVWDAGAGTSNWSDAANWNTDTVPDTLADVLIAGDNGVAPAVDTNQTVFQVQVTGGTLTVDAQLTASDFTARNSGSVIVNAGGRISGQVGFDSTGTFTNSGTVGGPLIVKSGTFNNAGSTSGDTEIEGGTLNLNAGTDLDDGSSLIVRGGTVNVNANDVVEGISLSIDGQITGTGTLTAGDGGYAQSGVTLLGSGVTVNSSAAKTLTGGTVAGTLGGSGAVTISGSVMIASTGTITGDLTVAGGGILRIGNSNAVGGSITTTGSVISYANGVNEGSALVISSATTDLEVQGTDAAEQSGIVSSTGAFGFEKIGTGSLTLSGANTYTGETVVSAGTLAITNGSALGTTGGGTTVANGATLAISGGIGLGEAITVSGTGVSNGGAIRNTSGDNVMSGAITLGSATRINSDANVLALSGPIGGSAALTIGGEGTTIAGVIGTGANGLTKDGTGTLVLEGASTYTGSTTVDGGTLRVTGSIASTTITVNSDAILSVDGAAIDDQAAITLNGNGTLELDGGSEVIGSLASGSTSTSVTLGVNTLTTGGNNASTTFAGIIEGSGGLLKTGTGTMTLTNANTFTGNTGVTNGTLEVTGNGALASSQVNVSGTGTLSTDSEALAATAIVSVSDSGTFTITGSDSFSQLQQSGGTVGGNGDLTLAASFSQSGGTTAGTLDITTNTFSQAGGATIAAGTTVTASGQQSLQGGTIAGTLNGTGSISVSTGTTTMTGTVSNAASVTVNGGTLDLSGTGTIDTTANSVTVNGGTLLNDGNGLADSESVTVATGTMTTSGADTIAALTQTGGTVGGSGQLTTGTFTQSGGTMSGLVATTSGATLNGGTISGTLSGAAATVQTNTTTLTGTNSAATTINTGGTLAVNSGTQSGAVTLAGGTLAGLANGSIGGAVAIGASGGTIRAGTGTTLQLSELNLLGGGLTVGATGSTGTVQANASTSQNAASSIAVAAGTLRMGSAGVASGLMDRLAGTSVAAGATLDMAGLDTTINTLTGAGTLTNSGGAAGLTLTGTSSFGGAIEDGAGNTALIVTGNTATATSTAVTLTGNSTFTGGTTVQGTGVLTASLTLQGAGSNLSDTGLVSVNTGGALVIDGDETLGGLAGTGTGTVTIQAGALTLAGNGTSTYAGAIGGTGSLVKDGTGTLTASGAISDIAVTVNGGTLVLSGTNSMSQITVAGTAPGGATLRLESNGAAGGAGGLIRTTGSVIDYANGVNNATPIQIASNTTQVQVTTGSAEQSGAIGQDAAGRPLEKIGAGELVLSGTNTFTGDMTITGGTLTVTGNDALANSVEVVVGGGATFRVSADEAIGALSSSSATATVEANTLLDIVGAQDTLYAGILTGGTLLNAGSGRLELTGNGSGLTGTLAAIGAGSEIAITGTGVTGATVLGAGTNATFATDGGAILAPNAILEVDGQVSLTGSETVGTVTNGTTTGIAGGTITLTGATTTLTVNGAANPSNPGAFNGTNGTIVGTGSLAVTGGTFAVGSAGNVQTSTTIGAGSTVTNAGSMAAIGNSGTFTNTGIAGALTNSGAGGGSSSGTLASLTHGGTGTFVNTGAVTGNTTLTGGTLNMNAGTNLSDTGTLAVSGGAANVNAAETLGTVDADGGTITTNATLTAGSLTGDAGGSIVTTATGGLIVDGAASSTFAGVISGGGTVQKAGTGTLTLTGAQTFTGTTTVTAGQLALTGSGALASTAITVAAGGSLRTDGGALAAATVITNGGQPGAAAAPFGLMLTDGGSETIAATGGSGSTNLSAGSVLTLTAGTSAISGVISGDGGLTVAGTSVTTLSGANTYTGPTTVNGAGAVLALSGGNAIADTGAVTVTAGTLDVNTAEVMGALSTASGTTVQLDANLTAGGNGGAATLAGSITGTGTFTKAGTGTTTLTGSNAAGATTVAAGTLAVGATGAITNATTVSTGATLTNAGTVGAVTNNGTFTATTATTGALTNTGTASLTGGTTASITNTAGTTTLAGASITGTIINSGGTVTSSGVTSATLINNSAAFNAAGTLDAGVLNAAGGTFTATAALSGAGKTFANSGTLNVTGGSYTGLASVTNSGTVTVSGQTLGATSITHSAGSFVLTGGTVAGAFSNAGVVTASGNSTIAGALSGSGSIDLASSAGADTLTFTGGAGSVGAHVFALNFAANGTGDRLISAGGNAFSGGMMTFNIDLAQSLALGQQAIVVEGQTGLNQTFTVSSGLGGAVIYNLADIGGNTVLVAETNPGIGGIASGVSLTQALIGNVVNRPTSPFVSGLAAEDGCSQGGFLRGIAGQSTATGTSDNGTSVRSNTINARFAGVQASYDFICNDGRFFNGWDGAAGVILGYNTGSTDQPVNLSTGSAISTTVSITTADFDQRYLGLYLVGSRDRLTADVQVRFENTGFTLNEQVVAGSGFGGLGLSDSTFDTNSVNVTGRISYGLDLNDDGLSLVPTAGLSVTRTGAAQLTFANGETLDLPAHTSTIGFVGGALARTSINPEGNAAATYFVSGNYYQEFGGDRRSVFTPTTGNAATIQSSSIGGFAEASVGLNYLRILEEGTFGGARQLNANLRADARFGENVTDSYSLTAQVRLSF